MKSQDKLYLEQIFIFSCNTFKTIYVVLSIKTKAWLSKIVKDWAMNNQRIVWKLKLVKTLSTKKFSQNKSNYKQMSWKINYQREFPTI